MNSHIRAARRSDDGHILRFPGGGNDDDRRQGRLDFWAGGCLVAGLVCLLASAALAAQGVAGWWVYLVVGVLLVIARRD